MLHLRSGAELVIQECGDDWRENLDAFCPHLASATCDVCQLLSLSLNLHQPITSQDGLGVLGFYKKGVQFMSIALAKVHGLSLRFQKPHEASWPC